MQKPNHDDHKKGGLSHSDQKSEMALLSIVDIKAEPLIDNGMSRSCHQS